MKGFFIVAGHFFLLLFLFLTGPIFVPFLPFNLIQIFSILFVGWALWERWKRRKGKSYKAVGVYLVKTGPYEFIRHPIYAGILLFVASAVQGEFTFLRFFDFMFYLTLILACIRRDERLAVESFKSEYSEYMKNTKKLIPYFY